MQHQQRNIVFVPLAWYAVAVAAVLFGCSGNSNQRTTTGGPGASGNTPAASGAGAFGNAPAPSGAAGSAATAGASGAAAIPGVGSTTCAEGVANTTPITPTVWLVLDGSGSMNEDFGGQTRWEALRAALMDAGGVVESLQHSVRFGMVLYSGNDMNNNDPAPTGECFQLVTVQPALDNYAALFAQYLAKELGGWTSTDRALDSVVTNLPVTNQDMLDAAPGPVYVVLATDGAPNDHCTGDTRSGRGGGSQFDPVTAQRVLDVVGRGAQMGMQMFVISLAGGDADLAAHLEQVASLGGTGQPPFSPANKDGLVASLQQIIGNATCQIRLDGSVVAGKECSGDVELNGNSLACASADGWKLIDPQTVQLTGTACSSFLQTDSLVHASFPCDAYSPD